MIPRLLAGFGLLASALQIGALSAPFFGGEVNFLLLIPLALAQLAQAGWLLVVGFGGPAIERPIADHSRPAAIPS